MKCCALSLFLLFVLGLSAQNLTNWQFRQQNTLKWMPAIVPGTVHTDLLANKKIPDPFFGNNESKLLWISQVNWEYKCDFVVTSQQLNTADLALIFTGLDTRADVFLNGKKVLEANNMFREWSIPLRNKLRKGTNTVKVLFYSPLNTADGLAAQSPLKYPSDNNRNYLRKAQYHFGWDFAPKLPTSGIWKKVYLGAHRSANTFPHSNGNADLGLIESAIIQSQKKDSCIIRTQLYIKQSGNYQLAVKHDTSYNGRTKPYSYLSSNQIEVNASGCYEFFFKVPLPATAIKTWLPGKINQPATPLCLFLVKEEAGKEQLLNQTTYCLPYYRNTVQLQQQTDSIGKSFLFTVNGEPYFIKGANWVPADVFLPRVTAEKYRQLLIMAKEANINLLRVWGGGIYENDIFYDLCDSLGILVWQDFAFAGAMYPADSNFLENVQQEIKEQLLRLQKHPSLVVWCGNNEIDEAWHNWGWQRQYQFSMADSAAIWKDYVQLFKKSIPALVQQYSGKTYINTSPQIGWGRKESLTHADCHYWGVWWGLEAIDTYTQKIPRFMSEYGMQAMPNLSSLQQFITPADRKDTGTLVMRAHQKHPTGFQNLAFYLKQENLHSTEPFNLETYIMATQELQSRALETAIKTHTQAQPRCMGTLFWQFNDCWPGISWSVVDYYGSPKKAYFTIQKNYKP
jgi:beta-mannosidase